MLQKNAEILRLGSPDQLELEPVLASVGPLVSYYQKNRSRTLAHGLAQLFDALSSHPDLDTTMSSACSLQRLAKRWHWLARHHS